MLKYFPLICILIACNTSEKKDSAPDRRVSNCENLPEISFNLDSIRNGLEARLGDTLWSKYWMYEHKQILLELDAYENGTTKLFPYSDYDSTVLIHYESTPNDYRLSLKDRQIKSVQFICREKATMLLNILNNPLNYSVAECGTQIPFAGMMFYHRNEQVAELIFACGGGSISFIPQNNMALGSLNEHGDSLFNIAGILD